MLSFVLRVIVPGCIILALVSKDAYDVGSSHIGYGVGSR